MSNVLVQQTRDCECEGFDGRVETRAVVGFHAIQTLHCPDRCFQYRAA